MVLLSLTTERVHNTGQRDWITISVHDIHNTSKTIIQCKDTNLLYMYYCRSVSRSTIATDIRSAFPSFSRQRQLRFCHSLGLKIVSPTHPNHTNSNRLSSNSSYCHLYSNKYHYSSITAQTTSNTATLPLTKSPYITIISHSFSTFTMTNSNTSSPSKPSHQGNPFGPFKVALIQLNTQDDVQWNIHHCSELIRKAAAEGAQLIVTPENTGRMSAQFRATDTCGETGMYDIVSNPDVGRSDRPHFITTQVHKHVNRPRTYTWTYPCISLYFIIFH